MSETCARRRTCADRGVRRGWIGSTGGIRGWMLAAVAAMLVVGLPPSARTQSSGTTQYLFGVTGGSSVVQTFTVNASTGALSAIAAAPAPLRSGGMSAVVNPAGTFLFIAVQNSANNPAVAVCVIAADGSVSEIAASPFSGTGGGNTRPVFVATSLDGKLVFLASNGPMSGTVDVFSVAGDGTLTPVTNFTISVLPVGMFLNPTGQWLYVYGASTIIPPGSNEIVFSGVEQFAVGASDVVTDLGQFQLGVFSTGPSALTGNPAGTFLFAAHGRLGSTDTFVDSLAVNPVDGTLKVVSSIDTGELSPPTATPSAAVDSTGNFLYTTNASYSITNGVLAQLEAMPALTTLQVPPLLASPTTPFLFTFGQLQNGPVFISSDVVGADGSLTPAPGSPYTGNFGVALAVTGSVPVPTQPAITLNPTSVPDFGPVVINQTGSASFSITNSGFGTLSFTKIVSSGDASFTQTNNCPATLDPNGSCTVNVKFAPTTLGNFMGSVVITSNAPKVTVALSGQGVNGMAAPVLSPQSLAFPDTAVGAMSTAQAFTAMNQASATANAVVQTIAFTGSNPGDFLQTNNCTAPIPPGMSCTINVTFAPQAQGGRSAVLMVTTNNGGNFGPTVSGKGVPGPSVGASQQMQSGPAGSTFMFTISENGFSSQPMLTATCNIPAGGCSITGNTLMVTTTARSAAFVPMVFRGRPIPMLMLAVGAALMLVRWASRRKALWRAAMLAGSLMMLAACGGGGGGNPGVTGTPAGNYQVVVKATAGAQSATTTVTVMVQ